MAKRARYPGPDTEYEEAEDAPAGLPAAASVATPAKAGRSALRSDKRYRVTDVRAAIWIVTDDDQLARMAKGDRIPKGDRLVRRCVTGDVVTDVPKASEAWMVTAGWIVPADSPADRWSPAAMKAAAEAEEGGEA